MYLTKMDLERLAHSKDVIPDFNPQGKARCTPHLRMLAKIRRTFRWTKKRRET